MKKRTICIVTGTRAEYGLLSGLMRAIKEDKDLQLQIIATGMHLSPTYGSTYKIMEQDGFTIDYKVEMLLSSDTPVGVTKSVGIATIGFADALERLKPDLVVVLGDRYEILAAAQAALINRIPLAHIHGGETTEGVIDESIRHAVTKMAHIHFVAADEYRKRVIQLGEQPERVFTVGAPGIDNIRNLPLLSKEQLEEAIGFSFAEVNFMVTYHPVTLKKQHSAQAMEHLLRALDAFPNAHILFTKPNSDPDNQIISQMIDHYAKKREGQVFVSTSMGQVNYLSAVRHADAVIGNSSSGLIEVPYFRKPTVNIGDRQKGRLKGNTVIDCPEEAEAIIQAIQQALSPGFQEQVEQADLLFGDGTASLQMKNILKEISLENILMKSFYDVTEGKQRRAVR